MLSQHITNIKITSEIFYIMFFIVSLQNRVPIYFMLIAHFYLVLFSSEMPNQYLDFMKFIAAQSGWRTHGL